MSQKNYCISVNGILIEVTKEQYLCYYRSKRRMRYYEQDIKTETPIRDKDGNIISYAPSKEDSFERILDVGEEFSDEQESIEDIIIRRLMLDKLREALDKLPNEERELVNALFFSNEGDGMSEREYAKHLGLSKTALHARKEKVLHKLKKFFGK